MRVDLIEMPKNPVRSVESVVSFNRYNYDKEENMCLRCIVFALITITVLVNVASSQRAVPFRSVPMLPCGAEHGSVISAAPPMSLGMTSDVLYAYVAFDSLAKAQYSLDDLTSMFIGGVSAQDVIALNTYIYKTIDYNPWEFISYLQHGWYINDSYYNKPNRLYERFKEVSHELLGDKSIENFLTFSYGIYEVRIDEVTIDTSRRYDYSTTSLDSTWDYVCMRCVVTDIIKGEALTHKEYIGDGDSASVINIVMLKGSVSCVEDSAYTNPDSLLASESGVTMEMMEPLMGMLHYPEVNDKYLIFANVWAYAEENQYGAPYYVVPNRLYQREGGMFHIENNILIDQTNYFGQGNAVNIQSFKNWLIGYITNRYN